MIKQQGNLLQFNINGFWISVPYSNNNPDFTAFTEPTLSVLQKAWQDFLDSGEELEIIPEPEPIPESLPANWDNFNLQMMSDARFNQVYSQCLNLAPIVANALPTALDQVTSKGTSLFTLIWNQLCAIGGATNEDREIWANYGREVNLPPDFVAIIQGEE